MTADKAEARYDFNEPVQIADETYWVGRREGSLLERNIYLRVFKGAGHAINLIIDPGPPTDLMVLSQKVVKVIGNLKGVNLVFINHQDPDVAYNAGYLQKMNPNLSVLCSEDTWRLIRFYDLNPKRHLAVESFKNMTVKLATGHILSFVPTPFCHFRGAVMLYDRETRVLFTGDLFGGLSYSKDLYADESYWEGLKTFHQIYMPVQQALKLAVSNIRALEPPPLMLAPQHGSIIAGEMVDYYLQRLEALPVGLNLLLESHQKENYIAAMNELLLELSPILGSEKLAAAMRIFQVDGSFPNIISIDPRRGVVDTKVDPQTAMDIFVKSISELAPDDVQLIETAVLKVLLGRNIPLPERLLVEGVETPAFFIAE
jgi:flavorubredoxin